MPPITYLEFQAEIKVEGEFPSTEVVRNPVDLLEAALRHALLTCTPEIVAKVVDETTAVMLHSISSKRRSAGDLVRVNDDDPERYNGNYQIAPGADTSTSCVRCGNSACREWPSLLELSAENSATGEFAYHVSECMMEDFNPDA
ncbi:hypothetical protein [Achromobacter spanius]|uniref:hypothetical protein n=1 Tax=Achromobacter spanius TaxID=217203 RepID=UPI003802E16A